MRAESKSVVSTPWFNSQLEDLIKKYRNIGAELDAFVTKLEEGQRPGDRMRGVRGAMVFETRMKNPDAGKGSSGGFRVVYHVGSDQIRLLAIATRQKPKNVRPERIALVLKALDLD